METSDKLTNVNLYTASLENLNFDFYFFRVLDFIFPSLKEVHGQGVSVLSLGKESIDKGGQNQLRLWWSCRVFVSWVCSISLLIACTKYLTAPTSHSLPALYAWQRQPQVKSPWPHAGLSSLVWQSPSLVPHGCSLPRWLGQSAPRHPGARSVRTKKLNEQCASSCVVCIHIIYT